MHYKKGFTLAEILVTLGVIGVIASMTVPTLVQDVQDVQFKTAWKKAFADLNQSYSLVQLEQGGSLDQYFGSEYKSRFLVSELSKHLSSTKTCAVGGQTFDSCLNPGYTFEGVYKTLAGRNVSYYNFIGGQIILTGGMHILFRTYNPNILLVFVDVNTSERKPNILGKDLFGAQITKDKIKPFGADGTNLGNTCNTTLVTRNEEAGFQSGSYVEGAGCSAQYLYQ